VAAIDPWGEDCINGNNYGEGYLVIQAAGDTGTVQLKVPNATYSSLGTRICFHKLMGAIYCIV